MLAEIKNTSFCVNELGQIFNKGGDIISTRINRDGYECVTLWVDGESKFFQVHRIVLIAFKPMLDCENLFVNHIDGNKANNKLENLEWVTRSENSKHSFINGLQKVITNQHGTYKVLTVEERLFIRDNYHLGVKYLANYLGVCERTIRKYKEYKNEYKN